MDPDRWRRIEELFVAALEQPRERRASWLAEQCPQDPELSAELLELLESSEVDRVAGIVSSAAREASDTSGPGATRKTIGRYRIVRELGHGGMGTVWLAERHDAEFDQQVAIKTLRDRWPSARGLERFQAERRILARLEHPQIARLIDGGTTEDGLPYVAMEYVRGKPIDLYCREHGLSVRERLELFCRACEGVQYAHRNLIVHRDLKASNLMVTDDGEPKLLDFGIAKLLDPQAGEPAEATGTAERVLTPEYASPEQILGEPITTASDVYSLGVLLYRLLTGRAPYSVDRTEPGFAESVATAHVMRPSAAIAEGAEARSLRKRLVGDLDNILLKALRREPERRYGTAAELAADLRRHLDGLPVSARPDTWGYRASKFAGRNRGLVVAVGVAVALLIAGAVTSSWLALRASREREEARNQAAIAREINDFLNVDLLGQADPYNEADRDIRLLEVVRRAADGIGERFAGRPRVEARIRLTLGNTFENLGEYDAAAEQYAETAALLGGPDAGGEPTEELIEAWLSQGGVHYLQGDYEEALVELERVAALELPDDDEHALTLGNTLALTYDGLGRTEDAVAALEETVRRHRVTLGDEDEETLTAINNLALIYQDQDRFGQAEPLLLEVLSTRREVLGTAHPDTVMSLASVGFHFSHLGELERAEEILREAIDVGGPVLGEDHPWHTNSMTLLGQVLRSGGKLDEAQASFAEAARRQARSLGEDHILTQRSRLGLARVYMDLGRHHEAVEIGESIVAQRRAALGTTHLDTVAGLWILAEMRRRAGRCDQAIAEIEPLLEELRRAYPDGNRMVGRVFQEYGSCLVDVGRTAAAHTALREAHRRLAASLGATHELTVATLALLEALPDGS